MLKVNVPQYKDIDSCLLKEMYIGLPVAYINKLIYY